MTPSAGPVLMSWFLLIILTDCELENFRFVNMISMATAKLGRDEIWTHVKAVRKEYYRKSLVVWPDKCLGFLSMPGLEWTESLKKLKSYLIKNIKFQGIRIF